MANNSKTPEAAAKKSFGQKLGHGCKEIARKFIVALKRRPQYIPLAVFVIAFIIYTFNMSMISNTTALLQGSNMGLAAFATMLFSMLSLVCFNNAFPYRKPVHKPMLILMFAMQALLLFCDWFYLGKVTEILNGSGSGIDLYQNFFIVYTQYYLNQHMILIAVGVVLTALLPVYSKLLRKINTNVDVADNGSMGAIGLTADA